MEWDKLTIQWVYDSSTQHNCIGTQFTLSNSSTGAQCISIAQDMCAGDFRQIPDNIFIKALAGEHAENH